MSDLLIDWIIAAVKAIIVFAFLMTMVPNLIWLERKVVALFQQRIGPNRVGPFGLLQPLADAAKLIIKENLFPTGVDRIPYFIAPLAAIIPALAAFAVIPFGEPFYLFGRQVNMQVADVNIGVLYILALSSLAVYAFTLAGWSSNNKYSLLGGLRASAQMISYELPVGLIIVTIVVYTGTLSLKEMVDFQAKTGMWIIFPQLVAFLMFVVSSMAELNRAPFDMPEAESELVAGYHTEYSGFRFAMFFMGEYVNMVTISALATVMFLGGWHAPFGLPEIPVFWFLVKIFGFIIFYMWLRATLPRIRYDKLMSFGWKIMIPAAMVNIVVTAVVVTLARQNAGWILTLFNVLFLSVIYAWARMANERKLRASMRTIELGEAGANG